MPHAHGQLGLLLFCLGLTSPVFPADREPHVFSGIWENDFLHNPAPGKHQDRHYTQGLKFIFLDRGDPVPWWAGKLKLDRLSENLPKVWLEPTSANYGLTLGQNIYTPEDDRATDLISNDRPYAGWLYLGAAIQRRGETASHIPVLESLELDLGIIGPQALGEEAQNTIHRWRRIATFQGWKNQLKLEPAFDLKYGRAWQFSFSRKTARFFDVIPNVGVDLGTVRVSGNLGVTARLGWNLPDDFGVQRIDSPILLSNGRTRGPVGIYLFGQADGYAVGRNAFLDGNLYRHSAHVTKKPLVGDLVYGLGVTIGRHFELSWSSLSRTREFEGQVGNDQFGSLMAKIKWGF